MIRVIKNSSSKLKNPTDKDFLRQIYDEKYRRKGLATYLYDYIERDLRRKLKPSPFLLKDGEKFWENRNKRKNV